MVSRESVLAYAREQYGADEQRLWAKYPLHAVVRHGERGKWFGVIMDVARERLGLDGEGVVDVLVVKADPMLVPALLDRPGFAPAYHVNKRAWGTIPRYSTSGANS